MNVTIVNYVVQLGSWSRVYNWFGLKYDWIACDTGSSLLPDWLFNTNICTYIFAFFIIAVWNSTMIFDTIT